MIVTLTVTEFFNQLFPNEGGWVALSLPDGNGDPTRAMWRRAGKLPQVAEQFSDEQLWFCPNPFADDADARKAEQSAPGRTAWADLDGGLNRATFDALDNLPERVSVVASGGLTASGEPKYHVYVHLDGECPPEDVSAVSRHLHRQLGGDASYTPHSAALVRLPGTLHRKDPANPRPVRLVAADELEPFDDGTEPFSVDLTPPPPPDPEGQAGKRRITQAHFDRRLAVIKDKLSGASPHHEHKAINTMSRDAIAELRHYIPAFISLDDAVTVIDGGLEHTDWARWPNRPTMLQKLNRDYPMAGGFDDWVAVKDGNDDPFDYSEATVARILAEEAFGDFIAEGKTQWYRYRPERGFYELLNSNAEPRRFLAEAIHSFVNRALEDVDVECRRRHQLPHDDAPRQAEKWRKARMRDLSRLKQNNTQTSMLSVIRARVTEPAEWRADLPYLLNFNNGVVDLRTGVLGGHSREYGFTRVVKSDYVEGAVHPDWEEAKEALDPEVWEYLMFRLCSGLSGEGPHDDEVVFCFAGGSNGKSTVLDPIVQALGGFGHTASKDTLEAEPGRGHPTSLMSLQGRRLVLLEEVSNGAFISSHQLKLIMQREITARLMRENEVTFKTTHTPIVTTNYDLKTDAADWGTLRRFRVVPFPYTFVGPNKKLKPNQKRSNPKLRDRLGSGDDRQHEAILAELVAYSVRLHTEYGGDLSAVPIPDVVEQATEQWRNEANSVLAFISASIEAGEENEAMVTIDVYRKYKMWCGDKGYKPVSDRIFWSQAMGHPELQEAERKKDRTRKYNIVREPDSSDRGMPESARLIIGVRLRRDVDPDEAD